MVLGIACCVLAGTANGQSRQINVERPAYAYEVLGAVPDAISQTADKQVVSEFLSAKQSARSAFEDRALARCPALVRGQITVLDFAEHLDREVDVMNRAIAAAYEQMNGRLSSQGRTALQRTLTTTTWLSADTKAVAVAEATPASAQSAFLQKCADAGWTAPKTESTERE
jgi:hypothetical protein